MFPTKKVQSLINQKIRVEMKGGQHILEGILDNLEENTSMHLTNTIEIIAGDKSISLGSVILRGNNIIIINPIDNTDIKAKPV